MIRLLLFVVVVVAMEECPSDFPYTTAYEPSKCQTTLIRAGGTSDFEWGYTAENGPAVWPEHFPLCAGRSQSPIDLPDLPETSAGRRKPFKLTYSWLLTAQNLDIKNNGHTVQINLPRGVKAAGGGLPATYEVAQFHFHWGSSISTGSEHTIGGKHAAMEVHIVTWNSALGDFGSQVSQPQGLAVLGFFIEIGWQWNSVFEPIVKAFSAVGKPDEVSTVSVVNLFDLVMPCMSSAYYRYDGSLTTPTCDESVVWTVFKKPIRISLDQWRRFTGLEGDDGALVDNFRPTQPLNGRQVKFYSAAAVY